MSDALVLGVIREAIQTAVVISLPMLAAGLLVGIVISILQTVTSIQDSILSFLPRAVVMFIVFAITFPWMLRVTSGFARALLHRLPDLVR